MSDYKILTINPGSTSTKIAVFIGKEKLFTQNIIHLASELVEFLTVSDQLGFREIKINNFLQDTNIPLNDFDAVVGRGGGLMAVEGGVYTINDILFEHAKRGANGIQHPANLGPQLAKRFSSTFGCPSYVVNPPDTDELIPVSRMTGIKGIYRNVHLHALNLKETAIQHAMSIGRKYEDMNFIVCHIGGGISVSAHRKGRMIDGNDIVGGEGPMAPTRCGAIPVMEIINYCFSGVNKNEAKSLCTKSGGFVSLLGTSDALEVFERALKGEKVPALAWNTMIYQINKEIGAMATVLQGKVDAILLGGGMVYNEELVGKITKTCSFIAPVIAYPGEFEMEAMAAGAVRVLDGLEKPKEYSGIPIWDKREFEE